MSPPGWTPTSWRSKPIAQDVSYAESSEHLDKVLSKLRRLPPLVTPVEVDRLRKQLAEVAVGKAFLLQGGDCAELFDDCSQDPIEHKLSLILIMSLIILHGSRLPVVRIARIAGQYAKPRSKPTEVVEINGEKKEVLSFRGDNVNGFEVDERKPDPERLLGAYFHSTTTLNYIRGLLSSGFADLHKPQEWSFSHVRSPALQDAFKNVIESLEDSLNFMRVASIGAGHGTESVDLYTSHEALMLEYEEALTRPVVTAPSPPPTRPSTPPPASPLLPRSRSTSHVRVNAQRERDVDSPARMASINNAISATGENPLSRTSSIEGVETNTEYYNLSAHFVWIGDRTRQLDGAHVEYFRGLANPIGIKVGPSMKPDELIALLDIVNPDKLVGKVTLIGRYGAAKVDEFLPQHIEAVKKTDHVVVWQCDAMHGNTQSSKTDATLKTRLFSDIIHEITRSMAIHRELGTILGGVHLELTGEVNEDGYSVTECIGGSMELEDKDLSFNYRSHCDPRLNYEQSLDVAFLIADHLKAKRRGEVPKDILLSGLRGRQ